MNKNNADIDLTKIETRHVKSQQEAFEIFSCQIFEEIGKRLGWKYNALFVKKNDAGGDGGVEGYWKFKDGKLFAIQAKFCTSKNNFWKQLKESIKKAVETHNDLTDLYVFTVFDRTDIRKRTNEKCDLEKWNELINTELYKKIKLHWMGKHEILNEIILQYKDSLFMSGLVQYWFDKNFLSDEWWKNKIEIIVSNAGDSYSEVNDYKISFKNIILEQTKLYEYYAYNSDEADFFDTLTFYIEECFRRNLIKTGYNEFADNANYFLELIYTVANNANIYESSVFVDMSAKLDIVYNIMKKNHVNFVFDFREIALEIIEGLERVNEKVILIKGRKGIGKTHFLTSFTRESLIEQQYVAYMFFGRHFSLPSIIESLNRSISDFANIYEFLNAINYYAKSKNQIAFVIIDAIDEWKNLNCDEIRSEVISFLTLLNKYQNIKLIISCVDKKYYEIFSYDSRWISETLKISNMERSAITAQFSTYYHVPYMFLEAFVEDDTIEISYLKRLCEKYQQIRNQNYYELLSLNDYIDFYKFYLQELVNRIVSKLELDRWDNNVLDVIKVISEQLINSKDGLGWLDLKNLVKEIDHNCLCNYKYSILYALENANFFNVSKDLKVISDAKNLIAYVYSTVLNSIFSQNNDNYVDYLMGHMNEEYIPYLSKFMALTKCARAFESSDKKPNKFISDFYNTVYLRKNLSDDLLKLFNRHFKHYFCNAYTSIIYSIFGTQDHWMEIACIKNYVIYLWLKLIKNGIK